MTKKLSVSSRPAKQTSVSAESIFGKPASKAQKAVLSRIAKRQAAGDDAGIDYSASPSSDQRSNCRSFAGFRKCWWLPRIDREVYEWLMQYGKGDSTRINGILRTVMEQAR